MSIIMERSARRLTARIDALEERLAAGDDTAWLPYIEAVRTLALLIANLAPERRGAYLTTAQMAERLNLSPKTLLKHKANGRIWPTLQRGKLIRWKGTEEVSP
jgi:hypothetical protein